MTTNNNLKRQIQTSHDFKLKFPGFILNNRFYFEKYYMPKYIPYCFYGKRCDVPTNGR